MAPRVLYHCPCSTDFTGAHGPALPSSSAHDLPALYFCEECDSIRCNFCTTRDLSAFYCPNCLFDVPLASVKQEKAKCPRNCFACPECTSTLSVVSSDLGAGTSSSDEQHWDPRSAEASVGQPPYYLACPTCRWDSQDIGLVFEKPTGITLHLQRQEETSADVMEYQNLRAHLDSYLRVSETTNAALAARSSKLLRDVPSLANDPRFAPNALNGKRKNKAERAKDEQMPAYQASMTWDSGRDKRRTKGLYTGLDEGKALGHLGRREQEKIDFALGMKNDDDLSTLAQRWATPQDQSPFTRHLGPKRIALRAKQTKRCPACRHIIIRPDTKPASNRFKIRLMALNYLPEVQIRLPPAAVNARDDRRSKGSMVSTFGRRRAHVIDPEFLQAGKSYLFEASFLNPLDDALTVKLHIGRSEVFDEIKAASESTSDGEEGNDGNDGRAQEKRRRPWAVTPTASSFPIDAFNAVWELEEEDDQLLRAGKDSVSGVDDLDDPDNVLSAGNEEAEHSGSRKKLGHGILRKRKNETVIGLELKLGSEAAGEIEFPMQVTFKHKVNADTSKSASANSNQDGVRSFSFWTFVRLGHVQRESEAQAGNVRRIPSALMALSPGGPDLGDEAQSSSRLGIPQSSIEQRRQRLDTKRSIMGLHDASSATG